MSGEQKPRWRRRALKAAVCGAVVLLVCWAVLRAARVNQPIRQGTSAHFWYAVCRVDLNGEGLEQRWGFPRRPYPLRDGWAIYGCPHMHGEDLWRVREDEVLADFPQVVRQLDQRGNRHEAIETGIRRWLARDAERSRPELFLAEIHAAWVEFYQQLDKKRQGFNYSAYQNHLANEADVDARWALARDWWSTQVVVELLFFEGLALFVLFPWLRSASAPWYALHLVLLPWLFLLPAWLGYAPLTFTSVGPSGGVLYPWALSFVWDYLPCLRLNSLDVLLLRRLPRPLWNWSISSGPPMAMTYMGGIGPTTAWLWGQALGALPWGVVAVRWYSSLVRGQRVALSAD
jgi:hypothetical protein